VRSIGIFAEVAAVALVAVALPSALPEYWFDIDHDHDVDSIDFVVFRNCLNGPNRLPAEGCASDVDSDLDGDVDLFDFADLQQEFTGKRVPAALPGKHMGFDLIGIHDDASENYNGDCLGCHADRLYEVALDGVTPTAHSQMLHKFGGSDWLCAACHSRFDFLTQSASNLRKQVSLDETGCTSCHGQIAVPGAPQFYVR
jgi:hypothetical protein